MCLLCSLLACGTMHQAVRSPPDADFVLAGVSNVQRVCQLTGKESINKTDRFGVYGTDLGSMFEHRGRVFFLFGDTFGPRSDSQTGGGGQNWRCNTMAFTSDDNPSNGVLFDGMIVSADGMAKELITAKRIDKDEISAIPTYSVSANNAMYVFYMSVNHWGAPGYWYCNFGGLARSTDDGQTWQKLEELKWPGDGNFVQTAIARQDGQLWIWGIPGGRHGGVQLMRVAEARIEDMRSYEYFAGMGEATAVWSRDMRKAVTIVEKPVGELSVVWNEYLQRWLMAYLNEQTHAIEMREGVSPWGPWSPPHRVCSAADYPALYGAYMHPRFLEDGGRTVYFAMSQWLPYNVFWMKAVLQKID